jgi:hypothetical protein
MRHRNPWHRLAQFFAICCLALSTGACGKKEPPRPPRRPDLPIVRDLQANAEESGVQLTWSIPESISILTGFNVIRSETQPVAAECPTCPRQYVVIRSVKVESGQTRFQVMDQKREPVGVIYYRVIPLDRENRSGPESNEVKVILP